MAGLCYEDFTPGLKIEHAIRRTVTEMDNVLFSALTYNCAPLHIDGDPAETAEHFEIRVIRGAFRLLMP